MRNTADGAEAAVPTAWWSRLHRSLMPDYNRQATVYWWTVVAMGVVVLAASLVMVADMGPSAWVQIAIGTGVAVLAGIFPVRIPHSKNSFAAGEVFIFLLLLMHGPAAAVFAAAGEAATGSYRTSRRWTSRLFSPAMAAMAMFIAGSLLHRLIDLIGLAGGARAALLIVATMGCALLYFVSIALMVSAVPRLKRGERIQPSDLIDVFGWVGIAYAGSAAVAALLYLTYLSSGIGVLMAVVPILAMMLATLHYFFRQQEAAQAVREAAEAAAAREAEVAQRHLQALQASEQRFHNAFTHASIGMALLSFEGRLLQANPALHELLGRAGDELVGRSIVDFVHDEDRPALQRQLGLVDVHEFEGFALELRGLHRDGRPVWMSTHCSFFSEPGADEPCLILQTQDITARRKAEQDLQHIAFHDGLTGLPNRHRFHEVLGRAVAQARSDPKAAFAVMFLDFDRFKLINDSLGHDAGDAFLVQVSQRIRAQLRPGDVLARLGGDEFAVLACPLEHERHAITLAERLMATMRDPFQVAGTELMTSASIGITFSALGYQRAEDVLRDADTAMYRAKAAGKARYALFDASLHVEVANRLRLEGDLRRAIDDGRLTVNYQPLFDLSSGRPQGFEALVRWHHPEDGPISPAAFLPIAEEAGLMLKLSDFVLNCACHQLREWQPAAPEGVSLSMSVNVSGHDIAHASFVARVSRALVESGIRPQQLCLELTEDILAARMEAAMPVLQDLRRLGVRLAIDDFGTGYSSLSHLSTLPIDELKIDRSFVARLGDGRNEAAVVRSIVLLGHSLGKRVVAEGIETEAQLAQLQDLGCRAGQGYLLGRPMTAEDAGNRLLHGSWSLRLPEKPALPAVPASTLLH